MKSLERRLERRIERTKSHIIRMKEQHGDKPIDTHTYHGGLDMGYWQGRLSTLENILDEIENESL